MYLIIIISAVTIFVLLILLFVVILLKTSSKYINVERNAKKILEDANKKAKEVIDDAMTKSHDLEVIYKEIEENFKKSASDAILSKIDSIKNLQFDNSILEEQKGELISNLKGIQDKISEDIEKYGGEYVHSFEELSASLKTISLKMSDSANVAIQNFGKMNTEIYDKLLSDTQNKVSQILDKIESDELKKFEDLSSSFNSDIENIQAKIKDVLIKNSSKIMTQVIKDVLHLSVSLADQEEYIMSVLEEHIEDIKNGI